MTAETRATFTPGPWCVDSPDDESGIYDAATIRADSPEAFAQSGLMSDYRGAEIAVVLHNPSVPEGESVAQANACLLAAAPELAAELNRLHNLIAAQENGEYVDWSAALVRITDVLGSAGVQLSYVP